MIWVPDSQRWVTSVLREGKGRSAGEGCRMGSPENFCENLLPKHCLLVSWAPKSWPLLVCETRKTGAA